LLEHLHVAGVDYDDITEPLERDGVKKFADSFHELFDNVEAKRDQLAATRSDLSRRRVAGLGRDIDHVVRPATSFAGQANQFSVIPATEKRESLC
jgi:hypothetical protein